MLSPVAITGIGLVTPLGDSADATWRALIAGRSITDHAKVFLNGASAGSSVVALGLQAASEAIDHAGWSRRDLESPRTALIVATSKGPVQSFLEGNVGLDGLAAVATGIASELKLGGGPRMTICSACSSGLHALIRASMMLRCDEIDRALVVGAEASVHPLFVGSFRRLGVLAPEGYGCRPFDRSRKGFLISDAAAAVCLECGERQAIAPEIARVERFAMGAGATHITGTDPSGGVLQRLIREVVGDAAQVDLIHAHGTGTIANDQTELAAMEAALRHTQNRPSLYSHKGAIGHSLGAAGLISIVINCMMHREGVIPGNANLQDPLPTQSVKLIAGIFERRIKRSLAMAAGFGGAMAVVSLRS